MCESACDCKNGARCNPVNGECFCKAGWTGKDCSQPCEKDFYGIQCAQQCVCKNGAQCDHISGKVDYTLGFILMKGKDRIIC